MTTILPPVFQTFLIQYSEDEPNEEEDCILLLVIPILQGLGTYLNALCSGLTLVLSIMHCGFSGVAAGLNGF